VLARYRSLADGVGRELALSWVCAEMGLGLGWDPVHSLSLARGRERRAGVESRKELTWGLGGVRARRTSFAGEEEGVAGGIALRVNVWATS
jgi:hypothetical protein